MNKPVKIVVKDEVGREVNPEPKMIETISHLGMIDDINPIWQEFEDEVKSYPAPSIPDGEHLAMLIDAWKDKFGGYRNCNGFYPKGLDVFKIYILAPDTASPKIYPPGESPEFEYRGDEAAKEETVEKTKKSVIRTHIDTALFSAFFNGRQNNKSYTEWRDDNNTVDNLIGFIDEVNSIGQSQRVVELEGALRDIQEMCAPGIILNGISVVRIRETASKALKK